jgi:hypothetical protein
MEQNTESVLFPRDDGNSSNTDYEDNSEARKKPKTEKKSSPAKKKSGGVGRGKKGSSAADKKDAAAVAAIDPEIPAGKDDRNPQQYIQLEVKGINNKGMVLHVRMKNAEFQKLMTTYCTRYVSTKHS